MKLTGKKIFVGLSGGVDSAVSAALLVSQGANVTGVFIKGWYPPGMPCTWAADRRDAMRVAAHLGIPFVTLDASREYKKGVIDYLLAEYRAGRTPNPDVMCNREVKFGAFFAYAKLHGAHFIATGHYARSEDGVLLRGVDRAKDQSYFLWAVSADALAQTLFPVGGMQKDAVRMYARAHHLPVATKKDSQGICFLGSISVEDFLRAEYGSHLGEAVDEAGALVGTHEGALLYTIGERVPLPQGPWYVRRKDVARNVIVVSNERLVSGGMTTRFALTDVVWHAAETGTVSCDAEYRYHGPRVAGVYDTASATFTPTGPLAEAVSGGQSLVLYSRERVLGGGIIR